MLPLEKKAGAHTLSGGAAERGPAAERHDAGRACSWTQQQRLAVSVQGSGDLLTESVCRREPRRPLALAQGARGGSTSHGQKELLVRHREDQL